jgi:hypothetical protein
MKPQRQLALIQAMSALICAVFFVPAVSAVELTRDAYVAASNRMGVVLLGVSWGRAWGYCGFENVQLQGIAFDRMPVHKVGDEPPADLILEGPMLVAKPVSVDYALLLEPGEYALSSFRIKAAKSLSDVGVFRAGRTKLIEGGKPVAGSFKVGANEIIYIGHFAPDCPKTGHPTIWRYYLKDSAAFNDYLAKVKDRFSFLNVETAQFRLLQTTTIGQDHQLQ